MHYKPDWPDTTRRFAALWQGQALDRPCLAVTAPRPGGPPPPPPPSDPEDRWLDPDWVLRDLRARLGGTWWGGEAVPAYLVMAGWVVSAGGSPRFEHNTIWFDPVATVDFGRPSPFVIAPGDPWVAKHRRLYLAVADEAGQDRFVLGQPCLLPANDLLSMHMGTTRFLTALMDEPEWMRNAILEASRQIAGERQSLTAEASRRSPHWYGMGGWMSFWAPEPFRAMQSDVSCMLSPEQFDRFVLPELEAVGRQCGAMWYHLDGGTARQHLPRLLSLPFLRVVQYTPMPGEPANGPEHLAMYRTIQAAGKIVHVALPKQNVQSLAAALDRRLLMMDTTCASIDEGRELLAAARRWV